MQAENVGELAGLVYLAMHDMIPGTTYAKSASDRMGIVIRKMEEAEYHLLRGFLYEAIFVPEGAAVPPEVIVDSAELQVYYVGFGTSKHDRVLVAEGRVVGAVWCRIMEDYGHINDATPSLAISVHKAWRGVGIGTAMMQEMLALLHACGYGQVSLSVDKANYAVRMYLAAGFGIVEERETEYVMVCPLTQGMR